MKEKVKLIEVFTTFQGEGPDSGQSMLILRFKRCNRTASGNSCPFCDTQVKMRIICEAEYTLQSIQDIINRDKCGILITGGEPTAFVENDNFSQTVLLLNKLIYPITNVETNGCRLIELLPLVVMGDNVKFIYSPKIFSSQDFDESVHLTKEVGFDSRVYIKVVCELRDWIEEYLKFLSTLGMNDRIYLMPEGTTRDQLVSNTPFVLDMAERYKFNFSSRLHIMHEFV